MKFVGIEKKEQGKFITRYDVKYETVDGILKNYEMISRNGDITDFEGLHGKAADAVVIIATDENDENRQRIQTGSWRVGIQFPCRTDRSGRDTRGQRKA